MSPEIARAVRNGAIGGACGVLAFVALVIAISPVLNWMLGNERWFYW